MTDPQLFMTLANLVILVPGLFMQFSDSLPFVALIAALAVEWMVFMRREDDLGKGAFLLVVLHLNFWSWFAGYFLMQLIPILWHTMDLWLDGPAAMNTVERRTNVALACGLAYILTVAIEYAMLRVFHWGIEWNSPFKTVLIANSISYPVYIGLALVLA